MIFLARNGVPVETQEEWSSARRLAAYIAIVEQLSGGKRVWSREDRCWREIENQ
ncbi:hypothetical protein AA11826_0841 [Komagataeibacter oboediens DSM 11826]|nr:hypothetical protein AA11826_0841 [Komagataeibacter oboediens DSM 11826]